MSEIGLMGLSPWIACHHGLPVTMVCHFRRRLRGSPSKERLAPSAIHEGEIPFEGDAGPALFADECLRSLGDDF